MKLELFNETCVLLSAYTLLGFTNWIEKYEWQYGIGWGLILLVLFNVAVNMFLYVANLLRSIKSKV